MRKIILKRSSFIVAHDKPYHFKGGTTGFFVRNIQNIDIISFRWLHKGNVQSFTWYFYGFKPLYCIYIDVMFGNCIGFWRNLKQLKLYKKVNKTAAYFSRYRITQKKIGIPIRCNYIQLLLNIEFIIMWGIPKIYGNINA